jgi:hypothetical protein
MIITYQIGENIANYRFIAPIFQSIFDFFQEALVDIVEHVSNRENTAHVGLGYDWPLC